MIVYVDVDNTLIEGSDQNPIVVVVEHIRRLKDSGVTLYCWSAGGAEYARESARKAGVEELFETFLPKPRVIIDDQLVSDWPFCVTVHPDWCQGKSWDDYFKVDLLPGVMNR